MCRWSGLKSRSRRMGLPSTTGTVSYRWAYWEPSTRTCAARQTGLMPQGATHTQNIHLSSQGLSGSWPSQSQGPAGLSTLTVHRQGRHRQGRGFLGADTGLEGAPADGDTGLQTY